MDWEAVGLASSTKMGRLASVFAESPSLMITIPRPAAKVECEYTQYVPEHAYGPDQPPDDSDESSSASALEVADTVAFSVALRLHCHVTEGTRAVRRGLDRQTSGEGLAEGVMYVGSLATIRGTHGEKAMIPDIHLMAACDDN